MSELDRSSSQFGDERFPIGGHLSHEHLNRNLASAGQIGPLLMRSRQCLGSER
jgi:hypothetical protein